MCEVVCVCDDNDDDELCALKKILLFSDRPIMYILYIKTTLQLHSGILSFINSASVERFPPVRKVFLTCRAKLKLLGHFYRSFDLCFFFLAIGL